MEPARRKKEYFSGVQRDEERLEISATVVETIRIDPIARVQEGMYHAG